MKRTSGGSAFLSCLLVVNLLGAQAVEQQQPPPAAAPPKLSINVIKGEGTLNNIKQRLNPEAVVEVDDENHRPVAGASVVFFLPSSGPSGTFANGTQSLAITTDSVGHAAAIGVRPNHVVGKMQIRVTASASGQSASAFINQSNVAGPNVGGLSKRMKILIAVGGLVGIGAAVYFGTHKGTPTTASGVILTPGIPSVGAPAQ